MAKALGVLLSEDDRKKLEELKKKAELEDKIKTAILKRLAEFATGEKKNWIYINEWFAQDSVKQNFAQYAGQRREKDEQKKQQQIQ